ncbi:MAG: phosphoribosylformylglycinamidine synthase, purS protein [Bradymonadales bacterium]|nr:MAG: phosphoribosylformylglycinamidine synthase, purS protein [Bradymonadales bacterium]
MKNFKFRVRVQFKDGILDPQAEVIFQKIQHLEFSQVKTLTCEKSFLLELEAPSSAEANQVVRRLAQDLLSNPVMESFEVEEVAS